VAVKVPWPSSLPSATISMSSPMMSGTWPPLYVTFSGLAAAVSAIKNEMPNPLASRPSDPGTRLPETRKIWFCADGPLA
jgi:hypothetical protein